MAFAAQLILFLTLILFFFGQLIRVTAFNINLPLFDIALLILAAVNIIYNLKTNRIKITNKFLLVFLAYTWIDLIFNYFRFHLQSFSPVFYLLRLTALFSFFLLPIPKEIFNQKLNIFFIIVLLSDVIFGLIQYFVWPDFTYFQALGWDPHLNRLIGTYFDPTFTALIILLFMIKICFFNSKNRFKRYLLALSYLALALTYSRSAYISFVTSFSFAAIRLKKPLMAIFSVILISLTLILLPRPPGEGTNLERTSTIRAKIENYRQGIKLYSRFPIIGCGYNTIPQIRKDNNPGSHANSAYDSSLLNILITTGIIGFILFLLSAVQILYSSGLTFKIFLVAIIVHSLFANSLFYPWIFFFLALEYSLQLKYHK